MLQLMGAIDLRQLLESFCNNSHWKYAVFWKLKHHNPKILSWEDGYLEHSITRLPQNFMPNVIDSDESNMNNFPFHESSIQNDGFKDYAVGEAVACMSHLQYAFGEGFVGRVAGSGIYSWHLNNTFTQTYSTSNIELPNEWLLQFASGIKTIILVPVLPHGVLQLGSLEVVAEDPAEVACIKDIFTCLFAQSSSFYVPSLFLDGAPASTTKLMEEEALDDVKPTKSNSNGFAAVSCIQGENIYLQSVMFGESSAQTYQITDGLTDAQTYQITDGLIEASERRIIGAFTVGEELIANNGHDNLNTGVLEGSFCGFYSPEFIEDQIGDYYIADKNVTSMKNALSFPADCELHKALGPSFRGPTSDIFSQSAYMGKDTFLEFKCDDDPVDGNEASSSARETGAEHLQEAVEIERYSNSDDPSWSKSIRAKSSTTTGKFSASVLLHNQSDLDVLTTVDSFRGSHLNSLGFTSDRDASTNSSLSTSLVGRLSSLNVNEQGENGSCKTQLRKGLKFSTRSRRRSKLGDHQRQRPRDRQLIQDRLKELRELVPNGAKCSIDGLLDRTVKHMLYLRGITEQANKLKQLVNQEVSYRKNCKSPETKDVLKYGACWAFEFFIEPQVCPIIVEDLDLPGHMLIEMLCNDGGLFLEIAQVLRRLDLTILKGMVECHSDNSWASFIVEGSRGFHRMDVFWPLMHLLQRKRNPISSKI